MKGIKEIFERVTVSRDVGTSRLYVAVKGSVYELVIFRRVRHEPTKIRGRNLRDRREENFFRIERG